MSGVLIKAKAGDSLELNFTVQEADGSASVLTGCTFKWGLAPLLKAGETVFGAAVLVVDAAPGITNPSANIVRVKLAKGALAAGDYQHELEITWPDGTSSTPAEGTLRVRPAVFPG